MDEASKEHLYEAIQETLQWIDRTNERIAVHSRQDKPDQLAIEGFEQQKVQLTAQLLELLKQFNIEIPVTNRAA